MAAPDLPTEFMQYVVDVLAVHIDPKVHVVAALIAVPVGISAALVITWWGIRLSSGRAQEAVSDSVWRLTTIVIIMTISVNLWLWDSVIADFIFNAAGWLTAGIVGTSNPLGIAGKVWFDMQLVAEALAAQGFWTSPMVAISVWAVYILGALASLVITAMHATSTLNVHLLNILGPVFVWLLMFETLRGYFERWVTMIVTYAITPLIIAIVGTILLKFLGDYAAKLATSGDVKIADVSFLLGAVILIVLVMWGCGHVASGLAGGIAMSGMGAIGAMGAKVFHTAKSTTGNLARGVSDGGFGRPRSQFAPVTRNLGNEVGQMVFGSLGRNGGTLVPRYSRPRSP